MSSHNIILEDYCIRTLYLGKICHCLSNIMVQQSQRNARLEQF